MMQGIFKQPSQPMWTVLLIMAMLRVSRVFRNRSVPLACTGLSLSSRAYDERPSKLMIVAHPDDESIFGGEALISSRGWMVICATGASNERRRNEFMGAMHSVRANYTMLDHADHMHSGNFDPRLEDTLIRLLAEHPYEMIVTHSKHGEYGHPQHRALHQIVLRIVGNRRLYMFGTNWLGRAQMSAAKEMLLKHYSREPSVRYLRAMAEREKLMRLQ
jgi:LmbE family N-acetylglucosaminyl deacetylase